jgi:hypothetical protein
VTTRSKPSAGTLGLAWDGARLWAGDYEERSVSALDESAAIENSYPTPGRPLGLAVADEQRLAVVISHPETDNRSIHFSIWRRGCGVACLRRRRDLDGRPAQRRPLPNSDVMDDAIDVVRRAQLGEKQNADLRSAYYIYYGVA